MLWRIRFEDDSLGWVEVGTGKLWLDDGTLYVGSISYTTEDTNPAQPPWYTPTPPPPPPPEPPQRRWVTKLAFRNRFKAAEKVAIELAAAHNPSAPALQQQLAAALRANLADQRDAKYIDLDRADTRAGVQQLETYTLIAAGRAAEILDAEVQDTERYSISAEESRGD